MTESAFRVKRRQKFLTEKFFKLNQDALDFLIGETLKSIPEHKASGKLDPVGEGGAFQDKLRVLRLHYTAGEPIESLKPLYADAMRWFAEWHRADETYTLHRIAATGKDLRLDLSPLMFEELFHYQLCLDTISLGVLLGEGALLRQAIAWLGAMRHTDMLFEAIIEPVIEDSSEVEKFFHEHPYDPLLDAIFTAKTPQEASAFVKKYLDAWYQAFEGVPWHNGHLVVTPEYSNYEGYWAFEAAAVCVIHGIDDSSFRDHLVYPKDLADWAREHKVLDKLKPQPGAQAIRLRCEAKQPCPQSGHWSTPAKANSRQTFKAGELMPEIVDSPWGRTIWYWDELQGD